MTDGKFNYKPACNCLLLNGTHPTVNTPVPSRNASAITPVNTPLKSPSATDKGCGTGRTKSGGGFTTGFDFFNCAPATFFPDKQLPSYRSLTCEISQVKTLVPKIEIELHIQSLAISPITVTGMKRVRRIEQTENTQQAGIHHCIYKLF